MRKLLMLSTISFLLFSCAMPENFLPAAATTAAPRNSDPIVEEPTETVPAEPPTITPIFQTPTFTRTPTMIGAPTVIEIDGETVTPVNTITPLPLYVDPPTAVLMITPEDSPGEGFKSFTISGGAIFWGRCKYGSVVLETEVVDKDAVWQVFLFIHLKSVKKDDTTPWYGTSMDKHPDGTFTYTLRANNVLGRNNYLKAWVVFQMVAVDDYQTVVGRSKIYDQSLTIEPCP